MNIRIAIIIMGKHPTIPAFSSLSNFYFFIKVKHALMLSRTATIRISTYPIARVTTEGNNNPATINIRPMER